LASKIKKHCLKYIEFSKVNSLFETNYELGFIVDKTNKINTGEFKYKLFLPQTIKNQEDEFDKLSLINLKPIRMNPFVDECGAYYAYAPIGDAKVLLLSASLD
jgi:hypothetical protein